MKPLLVTSGEPAGVGPDLCLALANYKLPLVVLGDKKVIAERASQLGVKLCLTDYCSGAQLVSKPNHLTILSIQCPEKVVAGLLNPKNSEYVMQMLTMAAERTLNKEFSGVVTAPVHKAVINQAGISFTGHTEFFANYCQAHSVVMMLMSEIMKVALVTTHLPLRSVADAITSPLLIDVMTQLHYSLQNEFKINHPKIFVSGLNPHAGEGGYLGKEELEIIIPTLTQLKERGFNIFGPFPADTMFSLDNLKQCDAFVVMYHDQGLPVLKYASFGNAVNVTLGLPIIRTSVDHGTALELAGSGLAKTTSLLAAVEVATSMAKNRGCN